MKFSAIAILALTTGAFALPGPKGADPKPKDPKPPKPQKPTNKNNQNMQCGNDQTLYCCYNEQANKNDVTCASFSNGGIGGICNGIQVCCQNNNGKQGCNVGNGGGKITIKDEPYYWGLS